MRPESPGSGKFGTETPYLNASAPSQRHPKKPVTTLPKLFSPSNYMKLSPLPFFRPTNPSRPPAADCYFQTSLRRLCHAGVFRLTGRSRPFRRTEPNPRFRSLPRNAFEVGVDSFSPQGVRSVGPRLFDNLILQASGNARSASLGHPFHPQGWPSGRSAADNFARHPSFTPLASFFQIPYGRRSSAFRFVFTKPLASWNGFVAQNSRFRKLVPQKTPFLRLLSQIPTPRGRKSVLNTARTSDTPASYEPPPDSSATPQAKSPPSSPVVDLLPSAPS